MNSSRRAQDGSTPATNLIDFNEAAMNSSRRGVEWMYAQSSGLYFNEAAMNSSRRDHLHPAGDLIQLTSMRPR